MSIHKPASERPSEADLERLTNELDQCLSRYTWQDKTPELRAAMERTIKRFMVARGFWPFNAEYRIARNWKGGTYSERDPA